MTFKQGLLGLALMPCLAFADGVTRSVEAIDGGCKITLAWDFAGTVESDLILEEHWGTGWSVDDATVPFGSLDATWFAGPVARFAVKPTLLAEAGSITFTVVASEGTASATANGTWQLYLGGTLRKGAVAGATALAASGGSGSAAGTGGSGNANATTETAVAITSFQFVGGAVELSYAGLAEAGTLTVEGCEGLGKAWSELKRVAVTAGDGKVRLEAAEVGACHFMRMKLVTEGK